MAKQQWYLYILECSDTTFYTGITVNLDKRVDAHNAGTASKYTRGKRPVHLVYSESFSGRASASSAEYRVKKLTKKQKMKLIDGSLRLSHACKLSKI